MKLPLAWLHDYTVPDVDVRELATRLAMTGTEVDRIHHHGPAGGIEHFVVGRVLSAEQHPDADRLRVCMVDVGEAEPSQIVCGAPNVAAGQTVAVAQPGSVMPDGTKLKAAKLRGVVSAGMICAEDELGIGSDHAGIMVLADGPAPGTPLSDVLDLVTDVLELEITPNRPDCLGVYGVAREVHAALGSPLAPPPWAQDPGAGDIGTAPAGIEVSVEDPELCPRFTARVFENVSIGPSPAWLKARLAAAGQRSISNVVDITNYVMLLSGHPLHAFDLDRIAGGRLTVRAARDGERLTTLDGQDRPLDPDMTVIYDADGPTSLAGVMGGLRSEVEDSTTRVLLEVATWNGPQINRTSSRLDLRSEASSRFEKGLPREGCLEALAVATTLMHELTGARLVPGTVDVGEPLGWTAYQPIRLRDARVSGLLGTTIPRERSAEILTALGFLVSDAGDGLDVGVPHWRRADVTREADLIEEVARLDGVDKLPATIQRNRTGLPGRLTHEQRLRRRAEDVLVGRGLHEVVGWSFTDPALPDRLLAEPGDKLRSLVALQNPMSADQSVLRPTIFGSLLDIARYNRSRGHQNLALFESGAVYAVGDGPLADEHHALGALVTGATHAATWADSAPAQAGFFTARALVEAVLRVLGVDWRAEPVERPYLHPGKAAAIVAGERTLGVFGEIHPSVAATWDFDAPVAVLAINLGAAIAAAPGVAHYADMTTFPELRQDLAVTVADDVPADRVLAVAREAGGELVAGARVFDVYRGEQVGEGRVSLALHLEFRAFDRTLTDEDVAPARERIVAALREQLGGELRG